ncbi:MAG TPA: outer membrane beta-barrel protein [Opitutaceae bacterium]
MWRLIPITGCNETIEVGRDRWARRHPTTSLGPDGLPAGRDPYRRFHAKVSKRRGSGIIRYFVTLALAGACHMQAAPFLAIGRNAELLLTGVATIRYDDNIFLSDAIDEADVIWSLAPGVEYGYDGGLTQVSIVVSETFQRYIDNSALDAELTTASLEIVREGANSRFILRAGYREYGQNTLNALSPNQTVRRNITDGAVLGELALGGRTRLAGGVNYDRARYPGAGFIGNKALQLPVDLYYALSAKLDLSLGYRHRTNRMDNGSRDSDDQFFSIGARGQFTPKLSGQVRVGWTERSFDAGGDDSQLGASADLVWFYSPKTTYRLTVTNDFSNSAIGVSATELAVSLDGRFELSDVWSTNAMLSFSSEEYENGRKDDFFVTNLALVYRLQENISLQGAYIFRKNSSNIASLDFTNNVLSLATSVRY